ncbi:hypothetical protein [Neobacillus massiliamazoniensis]|uniref:Uncharacterized protein n=1 Tax=Neobacillus massiliamazoniensis TaxID=1499688 RepID=A0A0U1NY95_9BACI|nr:hypothetical protein [Neobacillus massiliamazoniensis]CRK82994.1 hypothetical protein BN000_02949 [Neobacillus massiliamazoniensis]
MTQERKEIITLRINQDKEDECLIIVSLFGNKEVGIAVSEVQNGDAEIWLNLDYAKKISEALNQAIKQIEENY